MSNRYKHEFIEDAVKLYCSGLSANEVSHIKGANEATIRKWIKDSGIPIRDGGYYNLKHDNEIVDQVIELYNSGINTTAITKMMNLKRGVASYLLRKNDVKLRHKGPKSKIGIEDFFDKIDNEEKAYFLGWLMADGNISICNGQYSLKIHIALKDRELIDLFLNKIRSTNKTKIKEGKYPSYYVSLTSVHLCKSLMCLGVIPNKSGSETFPENIPKDLYRHFIRGVFDGDGITDICKKRSGFVGSYNITNKILEVLDEKKIKLIQNKKNSSIFYFLGGKKFSRKLYEFMYEDANVWLNRKRERMKMICFE